MSVQVFDWLAVQAELNFLPLVANFSGNEGENKTGIYDKTFYAVIPVLAKYTYRPSMYSFEGFLGPFFNKAFNISKDYDDMVSVGFLFGGRVGKKTGNGLLFLDLRCGFDSQKTTSYDAARSDDEHDRFESADRLRTRITLSVGYNAAFLDRK
jgi:hypothetical protein